MEAKTPTLAWDFKGL